MQTQTQTQTQSNSLDILQQFDLLLKNHSIIVSDRENLAKLFDNIVDLCTQMPKTKLKAALKAATQEPKTKAQPKPKAKAQSKPKEVMVGPDGAGDAPMISDLPLVPLARGRGRPRKVAPETTVAVAEANATPNAETAEKKRRGRPKKDKSVTISSNDDEDALIAKMMADVAIMQKEDEISAQAATATAVASVASAAASVVIPDPATDDDETDDECSPPQGEFTGPLMRCEEMTPRADSLSPVIHATSASFQQLEVEVSVKAKPSKAAKAAKEPKAPNAKEPKAPNAKEPKAPKAKEPKALKAAKDPKDLKAAKDPKDLKAAKDPKAKAVKKGANAPVDEIAAPLASFPALDAPLIQPQAQHQMSGPENKEINGKVYLLAMVPTTSFSYSGKTYLRTETDNVYDNLNYELIGVWDHSNHEIIAAFDDEEGEVEELDWLSDEE